MKMMSHTVSYPGFLCWKFLRIYRHFEYREGSGTVRMSCSIKAYVTKPTVISLEIKKNAIYVAHTNQYYSSQPYSITTSMSLDIAQWLKCLTGVQKVAGSIPVSEIFRACKKLLAPNKLAKIQLLQNRIFKNYRFMLPEYTRCLLVSGMFNTQAV